MNFKRSNRRGFTLIELLVVISIIGILSTLSIVSLNSARQKARDAKRISDLRQLHTALEIRFADVSNYPSTTGAVNLGTGTSLCLDEDGLMATCDPGGTTYMGLVPAAPTTPAGDVYSYCSTTNAAPTTCSASGEYYKILFELEGSTGGLGFGPHTLTPGGF